MKAMILAAGRGERMRPLTDHTPKPLLKVGGKPLIEYHIERLAAAGFKQIVINVAYLGEQIISYIRKNTPEGIDIVISDEREEGSLESAGGIVKALPYFENKSPFLVVNGDVFCDYGFDPSLRLESGILAHLVLVPNPPHNPNGDFGLDRGFVTDNARFTFSGIGYYDPKFFEAIPYGKRPLAPLIRSYIKEQKVTGELFKGAWHDVGTPKRLEEVSHHLKERL